MSTDQATKVIVNHQNQEMAKRLRQQAADDLADPDTARFRHLSLYRSARAAGLPADVQEGAYVLCGQINGKNQMGGYVGYRDFSSTILVGLGPSKPGEQNNFVFIADPDRSNSSAKVQEDCKGQAQEIQTNEQGDLVSEAKPE